MNFTAREKKLLISLGCVLFIVLYLKFFLFGQMNLISSLREEIKQNKDDYAINLAYGVKVKNLDSEIRILNQKLNNLRMVFPPSVHYDEILVMIKELSQEAGVAVTDYAFGNPELVSAGGTAGNTAGVDTGVAGEQGNVQITDNNLKSMVGILGIIDTKALAGSNQESDQEKNKVNIPDGTGYLVSTTLTIKGTNVEIKSFLDSLKNVRNKISISSVKVNATEASSISDEVKSQISDQAKRDLSQDAIKQKDGEKDEISANIVLNFYGIMDKNVADYSLLTDYPWVPLSDAEKTNLFKPFKGQPTHTVIPQTSASADGEISQTDYDFSMRALPFGGNMGLPSVTLSANHILSNQGYYALPTIYGDNKGVENVELVLEEKEGKYYFRFKTSRDSFPSGDTTQLTEFKPAGDDITMSINSSARQFKDDNAGVAVTYINKTKKNLIVNVIDDSIKNPRVIKAKTEGQVEVLYDGKKR